MAIINLNFMKAKSKIINFLYWSFIMTLLILNIVFNLYISCYNPTFWSDLYHTIINSI